MSFDESDKKLTRIKKWTKSFKIL